MRIIRPPEPETRTEIVTARQERRIRRRVHDMPNRPVVPQRHQVQARRVARVPRAQRRRRLVREQHVVLGVIEHRLRGVFLLAGRPGSGVGDQAAAGAELPQLDERVLAGGEEVLKNTNTFLKMLSDQPRFHSSKLTFPLREKNTEHTSALSCACANVLMHRPLTASHSLIEPSDEPDA